MENPISFEESNLANLGSIYEKALRMQRAEAEPEWKKIKKEPGLYIWRIEKFSLIPWPSESYGTFYQGDTYIILSIEKKNDSLVYTAHEWVGQDSSCDESGTAAYKIVELDDYFNREITLIYEEQGYESFVFMSYFKNLNILLGGIESGFKKVPIEKYHPKLIHVCGVGNCIQCTEIPFDKSSLNDEDVFIFDMGLRIVNWRGKKSNPFEKFHASSVCQKIKSDRNGKPTIEEVEEGEKEDEIENLFKDERIVKRNVKGNLRSRNPRMKMSLGLPKDMEKGCVKKMKELVEIDNQLVLKDVEYKKENLTSEGSFLIDRGDIIFIWVGKNENNTGKKFGVAFARKYQNDEKRNRHLPIIEVKEGNLQNEIDECFK